MSALFQPFSLKDITLRRADIESRFPGLLDAILAQQPVAPAAPDMGGQGV